MLGLLIFAGSVIALLAIAMLRALRALQAGARTAVTAVAAAAPAVPDHSRKLEDTYDIVAQLRTDMKAMERDHQDFEETVKRWMGRVNKQEARDAAAVASEGPPDARQLALLPPAQPAHAGPQHGRRLVKKA